MKKKTNLLVLVAVLCSWSLSASASYKVPNPFPWPVSRPEEQGLDSGVLAAALQEAGRRSFVYSLLVVRNGYLVAEGYFHGQTAYDANHIHSASKSFTSALVGIALRDGYIESLDQKMMDFFPEYITPDLDPRKYDITIRHLLTMRAGFDWEDNEQNWAQYANSGDWVKYAIELPLGDNPGDRFHYSTPQTNLLAVIIAKVSGLSARDFAEMHLFEPLRISIGHWYRDPQGYYTGGHEMYFAPRDMARFGHLYLKIGLMGGQSIVPGQWIEESTVSRGLTSWSWGALKNSGYGYQWWTGRLAAYDVYYASGKGGQLILILPKLNMVVVTTADGTSWTTSVDQNNAMIELAANHILPAVLDGHDPPPYPPMELSSTRLENQSLFRVQYIDVLKWHPNPQNNGSNITHYLIYEMVDGNRQLLDEVAAGTSEYWVGDIEVDVPRTYGVSCLTADNEESITVVVTAR